MNPNFRTPNLAHTHWRMSSFNENLIHGIIDWCQWSMLDLGGYRNISVSGPSGMYGGHMSRLRCAVDPHYTAGQVWEAIRSDWVWEQGVTYSGVSPTVASGVYVGGVFYPTASTTGTYAHKINYPLGRVIFNSPISTSSVVSADYSYREVTFVQSKEPWFTELLYGSFNIQRTDFLAASGHGGPFEHLAQARRQMPVVGVEIVNRRGFTPYEIGSLAQVVHQDVLFYVVAENDTDRNQLLDILSSQNDKTLLLVDIATVKQASGYPFGLGYDGAPVASPKYYPHMIDEYGSISATISDSSAVSMETINGWLYRGVVRATFNSIV